MSEPSGGNADRRRLWSDLGPRTLSALVLVPITAAALYLGGIWFALLVGAVFAGAYREWEIMVTGQRVGPVGIALIAFMGATALIYPLYGIPGSSVVLALGGVLAFLAPGSARMWRGGGLFYIGIAMIAVLAVRGATETGILAGVYMGMAVWLTDSGAFFTGRQVGGAKLSPDISPSKTWSGALGGLAAGAAAATIFWIFATPSPWWIGLVLAVVLSISGQLGDLGESAIKRRFRVKDSSDLIPGHGGLMDRLDSMALAALVVFAIGSAHAGTQAVAEGLLIWTQ